MPVKGQFFTLATWLVKEGREADFISGWKSFAEWTGRSGLAAGSGHLPQDAANPRSLLSVGPWQSKEAIDQWRSAPEFKAFFEAAREISEEIQPRTLSQVALAP
jgi:heme-degrading monooxygenase HmoA